MRELKLDLASLYPERTTPCPYDYSILVDELSLGGFACESYGARVTSKATGERAEVPRITVSISRIDSFMERLIRNEVSPIHLRDVVDDWL